MLGASALGRPRGMVWGGRREEGSGWGTHVCLWQIHFDIWQNQRIYMEFRKMVTIPRCTRQQKRHWCIEQSYGLCGRGRGWDDLGEWHWNMYNIIYQTSRQSRFDAGYWMLGAGVLGRPRGMVWWGRREEGSGWGTHVYLWRIHVDVWQNQYNIVNLKNKIKKKSKKKKKKKAQSPALADAFHHPETMHAWAKWMSCLWQQ